MMSAGRRPLFLLVDSKWKQALVWCGCIIDASVERQPEENCSVVKRKLLEVALTASKAAVGECFH